MAYGYVVDSQGNTVLNNEGRADFEMEKLAILQGPGSSDKKSIDINFLYDQHGLYRGTYNRISAIKAEVDTQVKSAAPSYSSGGGDGSIDPSTIWMIKWGAIIVVLWFGFGYLDDWIANMGYHFSIQTGIQIAIKMTFRFIGDVLYRIFT
jgi:hypothetical protein